MADLDPIIKEAQALQMKKQAPEAMPMQYEEPTVNPFNAPIPGQSLTDDPGNYPWEHSPQFTEVEDAADFLYDRISDEKQLKRLLTMMRIGVPIEALVKVITFSGFLEGKFTVDVAKLLEPIVAMQLMSKAQIAEVPAKINLYDKEDTKFFKDMAKVKKSIDLNDMPMSEMKEEKIEQQPVKGLMEK